jgi:hypothetical protein
VRISALLCGAGTPAQMAPASLPAHSLMRERAAKRLSLGGLKDLDPVQNGPSLL